MNKVFVDTAAFLALLNKSDSLHGKAKEVRNALRKEKISFVTTEQVVIEVANSLSKLRFRNAAGAFVDSILHSNDVQLVWTGKDIFQKAHDMYKKTGDKEWGMTDCIGFVVMKNEKLTKVFTSDAHFEQAGFAKLL